MTPQSFLENYAHYGSNIIAGKRLFVHIYAFFRKKSLCQQPEFHWWLPRQVLFFSRPLQKAPTTVCLIYTLLYDCAQFRNLMLLRDERLLPCWTTRFRFIGRCWYFNPQWTPEQAIKKASCVGVSILLIDRTAQLLCVDIWIRVFGGV